MGIPCETIYSFDSAIRQGKKLAVGYPEAKEGPAMIQRKKLAYSGLLPRHWLAALALLTGHAGLLMGMGGEPSDNREAAMTRNPLIEQAIEDLAKRMSVSPSAIAMVSFEEMIWPDTGMGCPRPGMRYKQIPQDGARIVLKLDGAEYIYHSGGSRAPFLCATGKSKPPQR